MVQPKGRVVEMARKTWFFLRGVFGVILVAMLSVTITASIDQNIFKAVGQMWPTWWFKATLADAYFAFLTFFVWVAYKEVHLWRKVAWFWAVMLLGTLAISTYMLVELAKLREGDTVNTLLTRRNG